MVRYPETDLVRILVRAREMRWAPEKVATLVMARQLERQPAAYILPYISSWLGYTRPDLR
jgi:hypothetical protein